MTAQIVPLPVSHPQKRISAVIVTYHTGASLFEALRSILADPDILEVVLVDNGNTPATRERLWNFAQDKRRLRLVQGQGNIGFGRACNLGANLAKGDFFLFLNPDAIIDKGAALALAECGENLTRPWITGGYLETVDGNEQRGARRLDLTPIGAIVSFSPLRKIKSLRSIHLETTPRPQEPVPMPIVSGAFLMCDRQSFNILGGFDERYFLHVEDIDICRRARLAGGEVYFVPSAKVLHYGSTSEVRLQNVEMEKFKGFVRYFWNYSPKIWAKTLLVFAIPAMYLAIMGRAWWHSLRSSV